MGGGAESLAWVCKCCSRTGQDRGSTGAVRCGVKSIHYSRDGGLCIKKKNGRDVIKYRTFPASHCSKRGQAPQGGGSRPRVTVGPSSLDANGLHYGHGALHLPGIRSFWASKLRSIAPSRRFATRRVWLRCSGLRWRVRTIRIGHQYHTFERFVSGRLMSRALILFFRRCR